MRLRLAVELLPLDEARLDDARLEGDLDADALPLEDAFALVDGADLELREDEDDPFDEAPLEEAAVRPEAEEPGRLDDDLADADFLLPDELELLRPPDDLLADEERPNDARPEDWLRDFFISNWFYNDD